MPAYEVKDEVGNIKTIHPNRLFLVATPKEAITPLGAGVSISEENFRSTWAEHTLLEVESDSPEGSVDWADTLSPASRVPLGWVGVLWLLPAVAPRPTMWRGIGAGDGMETRVMRKSTRPAGGTSKPCSCIPETRCYKGVGAQQQ